MTGEVFDCEVQARFRDINVGGHVDNVEAMRVIDEARIQFFMFAPVHGDADRPGLLRAKPAGIVDLMGAQRIEYHAEMRFVPFRPFLVRLWVSRVGRTSFDIAAEMRVTADQAPALVAESSLVCWDNATQSSWPLSDQVRADLERFSGPGLALRGR